MVHSWLYTTNYIVFLLPTPESRSAYSATTTMILRDHHSIGRSTELRFRDKDQVLFLLDDVGRDQQLVVLIDKTTTAEGSTISVQPSVHSKGSFGTALLRALGVLVSAFVLTVWMAFSIQCIIFLFMNVVGTYTPEEWTADPPIANLVGCVFACPLLLLSLARTLTMSWACTVDCWRGLASHPSSLWKNNTESLSVSQHAEWTTLVLFSGIPLLTCGVAAFVESGAEYAIGESEQTSWYDATMLAWAGSVLVFQFLYMELCVLNELVICHRLLQSRLGGGDRSSSLLESIETNLLLTQRQKYSGLRRERYLVDRLPNSGVDSLCNGNTEFAKDEAYEPIDVKYSFGTRLTKLLTCCYDSLERNREQWQQDSNHNNSDTINDNDGNNCTADDDTEMAGNTTTSTTGPKRNYTIDEVFGNVTIRTRENWSLEQLWCIDSKRVTSLTVKNGTFFVAFRVFLEPGSGD